MKYNRTSKYCGFAAAALLLAGAGQSFAQTADLTINTFDTDPGGNLGHEWGSGTQAFDGGSGNPPGAALITVDFSNSSDTPCTTYLCLNGNPWYVGTAINFSQYKAIEFDIKWDNTSDITIDQFNNVATIPLTATNSLGQTILNHALDAGSIGGLEIDLCGGPGGQMAPLIVNTNIPAAAANGWVHMVIPIDQTAANLDGCSGFVFHKWVSQYGGQIANDFQGRFWIDNVTLQGTAGPPPPPIVKAPTKATQGLNVFASTAGLYDRQSAVLRQSSGLTWVGMATPANPVTYSFTIAGYPNSVNCEAWMFLVPHPNASYLVGAPDWNETNVVKIRLQGSANSGTMQFQYKVNEPNQQAMYSGGNDGVNYWTNAPGSWDSVTPNYLESGYLGLVTNNSILGTWTIKFTSDTAITLIAPNGNSTNLTMPSYNTGYFAETTSPGFYIYLGMQANNADALNQAVVYSNFAVTGTAQPFSENFLTDSVLDTTNTWNTSASTGPKGVFIAPAGFSSWVTWTLPDSGFSLETSPTLSDPLAWTSPTSGPILGMNGIRAQLLSTSDIPAGNTAFFQLIKRAATQLQVLFPGETNAPNTVTGKIGTPTSAIAYNDEVDVMVYAVDPTFHIVNSTDTVNLSTTDGSAIFYSGSSSVALVNGMATVPIYFGTPGPQTVTADDTTNTNITSSTSSPITIQ